MAKSYYNECKIYKQDKEFEEETYTLKIYKNLGMCYKIYKSEECQHFVNKLTKVQKKTHVAEIIENNYLINY